MSRVTASRSVASLMAPCRTPAALHAWVRAFLGIDVPARAVCPGHDAPFDYLRHAYFEPARDVVVWAPRGGGKTRLGAAATLLDLLHKPGVAARILGGSVEQSMKMWEHLLPDLERLGGDGLLATPARSRRVALRNGSAAAVLTQSQRAVRGLRVQKLRCDEVELFDPAVWEAAQLVTRSLKMQQDGAVSGSRRAIRAGGAKARGRRETGKRRATSLAVSHGYGAPKGSTVEQIIRPDGFTIVSGVVEALSTLHAPYGLMGRVIESAQASGTRVIRWCVLDVLERCPPERECASCPLWDDCRGVAKERCSGFVRIDDAIAMKRRVSAETWQAEMLCRRPSVHGCVFPSFDPAMHVTEEMPNGECRMPNGGAPYGGVGPCDPSVPFGIRDSAPGISLRLAIDFGYANPFVCLWVLTRDDGVAHVIDEYVQRQRTVEEHVRQIGERPWGTPAVVACDPAGAGRNEQTGESSVQALERAGYRVRKRSSRIVDGLELIRAALRPASGPPRLYVHPRCVRLIKAMRCYRYPEEGGELPVKDGEFDHPIDALRYHFVNARVGASLGPSRPY